MKRKHQAIVEADPDSLKLKKEEIAGKRGGERRGEKRKGRRRGVRDNFGYFGKDLG